MMTTLFWDPFSGIAGNMSVASLVDLGADAQKLREGIQSINFPEGKLEIILEKRLKDSISATYFNSRDDEDYYASDNKTHEHAHGQERDHDHDHDHNHEHSHENVHMHGQDNEHEHEHEHRHEQMHDSAHAHVHNHIHEHEHDHDHEYDNEHKHAHGNQHDHTHEHAHEQNHQHQHNHTHTHNHDHDHGHTHDHEKSHQHNHDHAHNSVDAAAHAEKHSYLHRHREHRSGSQKRQQLPHRGFSDIKLLIEKSAISENAKEIALSIFHQLAIAEASVHGSTPDKVHFHEVGARDSIADIVGTAICIDDLGITNVFTSPVHIGTGFTRCRHGVFPIPAPATAILLKNYPVFTEPGITGELTTPTGAAILAGLSAKPGFPKGMAYQKIGYGAGSANFGIPNVLRAFLGNSATGTSNRDIEGVGILETNLDNVTGELMGYVSEKLMNAGALDVSFCPIFMKKSRPGYKLSVMTSPEQIDEIEILIFNELPTLGIRRQLVQRTVLSRKSALKNWQGAQMQAKEIIEINGKQRTIYEYESRKTVAEKNHIPLRKIPEEEK
ncbi:MAG: nickel pincer cofactor biosynthesis protein LarC [Candidatus Riflebacteria bacterium]|nr:nickel pincer cofactor biosynthesis protein LarC [Candidatus Riflebacteria bacterium]